ncbi:MAG: hydrogenase maturation nickel metallochaperone HypA [Thermodesulfobacteriota bacterium]
MHELPVIEKILRIVLLRARDNGVEEVRAIHLKIGELSDLEEEWMQRYFDYCSRGTLAEGSRLVIERVPVRVRCRECGQEFPLDLATDENRFCPECNSPKYTLVSGQGYFLESIEAI